MSVAIIQARTDPIDSHGVGLPRAYGSLACVTEGTVTCHGYRIRPVSPCAALSEIGNAVVASLGTSLHWFPLDHEIVEAGGAGLSFSTCAWRTDLWS